MRQIIKNQTIPDTPAQIETPRRYVPCDLHAVWLFTLVTLVLILSEATVLAAGNPRQLDLYHTHTGESLSIIYHDGEKYNPAALEQINEFLGDFRNSTVHAIDPATLDILFKLRTELGNKKVGSAPSESALKVGIRYARID